MLKEFDALEFVSERIDGINDFKERFNQMPPVYVYYDELVEIKQTLLKGQELKKDNERLYQDIYDLKNKNTKYLNDLYSYSEMLDKVEKENADIKQHLKSFEALKELLFLEVREIGGKYYIKYRNLEEDNYIDYEISEEFFNKLKL